MTGFGKHVLDDEKARITIELKSLNSKTLDINCRLPANYRTYEIEIRNLLGNLLERGKIDCSLNCEMKTAASVAVVNQNLAEHYYRQFQSIADKLGIDASDELLTNILKMPDVFLTSETEADEHE